VLGLVNVDRAEANAFSEADERLLSTLASSMGVALENAHLFDETKRVLAETEQRNAELAVVNEIGAALARQLEFDAIIDLVGERLAAMFHAVAMYIGLYDKSTNVISFPFELECRNRVHGASIELGLDIAAAMEMFWVTQDPREGMRWFSALFEHPGAGSANADTRAHALRAFGSATDIAGDDEAAARPW
jgi:hypothetical protein